MSVPVSTLIADCAGDLNLVQLGQSLSGVQGQFALRVLNELIDLWNAKREMVWCDVFTPFTLVPGLQPHTIGPTGTWVLAIRPVTIDGLSLALDTTSPTVRVPIRLQNKEWYLNQPVAGLTYANSITSAVVTDAYFEEDWPNGKLYLYPAPTTAYQVIVMTRTLLGSVAMTDSLDVPPAYRRAFRLTLDKMLANSFGRTMPPDLAAEALHVLADLEANNIDVPTLVTRDAGMPGGIDHRPDFFWPTGQIR